MKRKNTSSISISSLARFSAEPSTIKKGAFQNAEAIKYGNRAHESIGKRPRLIYFVLAGAGLLFAALRLGLI